jgi:hypothetical protein
MLLIFEKIEEQRPRVAYFFERLLSNVISIHK